MSCGLSEIRLDTTLSTKAMLSRGPKSNATLISVGHLRRIIAQRSLSYLALQSIPSPHSQNK